MNPKSLLPIVISGLIAMLSSCIDSKYDLSDIDTTTRVNVNSLVVPINIDEIQLKSIIDVNTDDPNAAIQIVDGAYAYVKEGDFSTSSIDVYSVSIKPAANSKIDLNLPINIPNVGVALPSPITVTLPIPQAGTEYLFKAYNLSEDICGLSKVEGLCNIDIVLKVSGLAANAASYTFKNIVLELPKGMEISECTGAVYSVSDHTLRINSSVDSPELHVSCTASALNIAPEEFDRDAHKLTIEGQVGIVSGDLEVTIKDLTAAAGTDHLGLTIDYTFDETKITSVDGAIKYSISNVNIPDINLNNLPDVLKQHGTGLTLANPQIYLAIDNPLYVCGAYAQTGFEITSVLWSAENTYAIDEPYFTIPAKPTDYFCFSPSKPANPDPAFPNCEHIGYKSLSRVLYGEMLPEKLKVNLVNPCLPEQEIKGFKLGHDYGKLNGKYKIIAPLQLEKPSCIKYTDKLDGWSSEDLDKLTITEVVVNLNVTTDIPLELSFFAALIDKNGHQMNGETRTMIHIQPNAQNQELSIKFTGDIHDLDGIDFEAWAIAKDTGNPLNPDMTIKLSNIRPCVTGYYQTEL